MENKKFQIEKTSDRTFNLWCNNPTMTRHHIADTPGIFKSKIEHPTLIAIEIDPRYDLESIIGFVERKVKTLSWEQD